MAIKSPNQRLTLFLLLPVALLLFLTGFVGFIFARGVVLDQWQEETMVIL